MKNRLKINHCPGTWEEDSSNDHSPLERGQYVLERVFLTVIMVLSMLLLLSLVFADFVKVQKKKKKKKKKNIAVLFIKHTCTRTINLQFFLQDPPVFYQEKRTNIATENHFFFFYVILNYIYGDVLTLKNAEIRGKGLFDSTAEYRFLKVVMGNINLKKK